MKNLSLLCIVIFSAFGLNAQCIKTMMPMASQPLAYGAANDAGQRHTSKNYHYYKLYQPNDSVYGYLNHMSVQTWDGNSWNALPAVKATALGTFQDWGNRMLFTSGFLRYANGIKAPAGKILGPLVFNGSTWDTLPGGIQDSGVRTDYFSTDYHIFRLNTVNQSNGDYNLYCYDTSLGKFSFLYQLKSTDPLTPTLLAGSTRLFITRINKIDGRNTQFMAWVDSALQLHTVSLGFSTPTKPVVGMDRKTNRIYFFQIDSITRVYEFDTSVISSRLTRTPVAPDGLSANNYFVSVSKGTLLWNTYFGSPAIKRGYYVLCPGETLWNFSEVSLVSGQAPYIMNVMVGTEHGIYSLESANRKILQLESAFLLKGKVLGDLYNICRDSGQQIPLKNWTIGVSSGSFAGMGSTDNQGNYRIAVPKGQITYQPNIIHFSSCFSETITVNGDTSVPVYLKIPDSVNIRLMQINPQRWRWNSFTELRFGYINLGKHCDSGRFELKLPAGVYPKRGTGYHWDSLTNTISGTLYNLNPLDLKSLSFWVGHDIGALKPDTTIEFTMKLYSYCSDADSADNTVTFKMRIVYSFDPNFKDVDREQCKPLERSELRYHIGFQNEGSDYAENIVLRDTLSESLDPESFRITGASHPFSAELLGRVLIVTFRNIMLPAKKDDAEKSQGYFTYTINTKSQLPAGTLITNRAGIYFDLNAPILTNTAATVLEWPLSIEKTTMAKEIRLYPNPAVDAVSISHPASSVELLAIYDAKGALMYQSEIAAGEVVKIPLQTFPDGLYFVRLGHWHSRLLVQH